MADEKLLQKIAAGPVYLANKYQAAVIRFANRGRDVYVKFRGGTEFLAGKGSSIVADSLISPVEITENEYKNY